LNLFALKKCKTSVIQLSEENGFYRFEFQMPEMPYFLINEEGVD